MAKRITQLTELTTPAVDDYIPIVDTSSGTTKKITYRNLVNIPELGWTSAGETWVYASATTFTVAGVDVTSKYPVGTKIRLKQGGSYKYFYIVSRTFSTNTTITVTGGSDYSLANSAITDNYFSYSSVATDFPQYFNYSPTISNVTSTGATIVARFSIANGRCHFWGYWIFGSGSAVSSAPSITLPVAIKSDAIVVNENFEYGNAHIQDTGTAAYTAAARFDSTSALAIALIAASGAYTAHSGISSTLPMTWASGDKFQWNTIYPIV